jgi:hypothetical protein
VQREGGALQVGWWSSNNFLALIVLYLGRSLT